MAPEAQAEVTLQDRAAAWIASPPAWAHRVVRGASIAIPVALVGYGLLYERNAGLTPTTDTPALRYGLYALAGGSLYLSRRMPYVTVLSALLCWWGTGSALFAIAASFIVALRQQRGWWAYLIVIIVAHPIGIVPEPQVFAAGHALLPIEAVPVYASIVPALAGFALAMAGRAATQRKASSDAEIAAAHSEARSLIALDRLRISRDMHDILGHRLSLMVLHATAADSLVKDEKAHELLGRIARDGSETIEELQYILKLLRQPDADVSGHVRPTLAESIELAEAEGLALKLQIDQHTWRHLSDPWRSLVEATASEALHNAAKYAAGSVVNVRLDRAGSWITFRLENDAPASNNTILTRGGLGLTDLAQRAEEVGGIFTAQATAAGGFRVELRLPA